jgi:TPR repeat protein
VATEADREFGAGRFGAALELYDKYDKGAAAGDPVAAEMAGYMLYFGPALFGPGVPCSREKARHWLTLAAREGRPLAQMMIRRMDEA